MIDLRKRISLANPISRTFDNALEMDARYIHYNEIKLYVGRLKKKISALLGKGQNNMIQANRQVKSCLGPYQTFLLG